jgi:predicted GNAT family acetyltransferase
MAVHVTFSEDPAWALAEARAFLASEPALHNLLLTLLSARAAHPEPGRYWLAYEDGAVAGVTFQSPLHFFAVVSPMKPAVIEATVDAIVERGVALPGVNGEATTAARFAGQWTERRKSGAAPMQGQRLYELVSLEVRGGIAGGLRQATAADRELVRRWMLRFQEDVGELPNVSEAFVERRIDAGEIHLWEDGEPVSMAAYSPPVEGVVRVQCVWTLPERRKRGYAEACVAELSLGLQRRGYRCILYTDLGNPISNSIYRRIGYRAISEGLRYRFDV